MCVQAYLSDVRGGVGAGGSIGRKLPVLPKLGPLVDLGVLWTQGRGLGGEDVVFVG